VTTTAMERLSILSSHQCANLSQLTSSRRIKSSKTKTSEISMTRL